ncbi:MAG: putative oxidoreductase C-terminal domain-containing protein [Gemmataceae bacterium]
MADVRLMTYAPGHFHAALIQKEMYPGVSPRVHVYSPLDADLLAHLGRIAAFNSRAVAPTSWEMEVHTGPQSLSRLLQDRPGNVVVLSGRNRGKIDALLAALEAGLHVLADKPWVIRVEDLPRLSRALETAQQRGLIALDVMTERWEVTTQLQRELLQDPAVFGTIEPGSESQPSVVLESEHFLCKTVAGVPLRRPTWFFDTDQAGEGLSDVGTHLVDLVPWLLFPNQPISLSEIELLRGSRIPTMISRADFQKVTGEKEFPPALTERIISAQLLYYCNNTLLYRLRGIHVWLCVSWAFEAAPGQGDRHLARFQGTLSSVEVRQGAVERFIPEVYIVPRQAGHHHSLRRAIEARLRLLQPRFSGVGLTDLGDKFRLEVPDRLRIGHEAHFAEVVRQFLAYLNEPSRLPSWEKSNMLAKYHVTTNGVELARQ